MRDTSYGAREYESLASGGYFWGIAADSSFHALCMTCKGPTAARRSASAASSGRTASSAAWFRASARSSNSASSARPNSLSKAPTSSAGRCRPPASSIRAGLHRLYRPHRGLVARRMGLGRGQALGRQPGILSRPNRSARWPAARSGSENEAWPDRSSSSTALRARASRPPPSSSSSAPTTTGCSTASTISSPGTQPAKFGHHGPRAREGIYAEPADPARSGRSAALAASARRACKAFAALHEWIASASRQGCNIVFDHLLIDRHAGAADCVWRLEGLPVAAR